MKKMKKLNLNKVRIVSLKNLQSISGGSLNPDCVQTSPTTSLLCTADPTLAATCPSTGPTYGGNDGGTLKSAENPPGGGGQPQSFILTECEIADM